MLTIFLLGVVASSSAFLESFWLMEYNNCSTRNEFACRNNQCIPLRSRCDNKTDCKDGSDESDCDSYLCKDPMLFRCNNSRCIHKMFVCDDENDCEDFSDEVNCEAFKKLRKINSTCEVGHWQCTDKLCIPNEWVCNGQPDCLDGSDELIGCSKNISCDGFKCKSGQCIPLEWKCDGAPDCPDKSDEDDCKIHNLIQNCTLDEGKFLCANNKTCIDLHQVCNGLVECPDKSDESHLCHEKVSSCSQFKCSHTCAQLATGPKCICPKGFYIIDGKTCLDINECEEFGICDQKCRNLTGSYECYCDPKYALQDDKKSCKVVNGEAMMVFSTKTEIRAYTLESQLYFPVVKNLKQVVGVHYDGHHIYWTDIYSEHESIMRSIEDGSERELIVTSGLGLPEDLAVDWLTGNIYFTDVENKHIGVCSSDGFHCTILVNRDIRKPRGIVLNIEKGEMYWTDWGEPSEIAYSLMDGSNDKSFVSVDIHWPNSLALDYPNGRLYWTDAKKMTLESIRLDGTERRIILKDIVKHPYAIAVFENKLYWSDWATSSIQSCDKFSGKNHHTIVKEHDLIYGINIFHSVLQQRKDNPCSLAFCSDLCLLRGTGYACACPQNKVLSSDRHLCKEVGPKQMLIVGYKNMLIHIEHQVLGKHDVSSLPTVARHIGALVYDSHHNVLLISDISINQIVSLDLETGVSKTLDISRLGKVMNMDYDPRGNNLYVCDSERRVLEVINLNTLSRKILLHSLNSEIPQAVALVPNQGVMFVAMQKSGKKSSHIDRFYMDGTGRTHSIEDRLQGPISLYYDHDLGRVFIADAGTRNIESTSSEGDDRHIFRTLTTSPVGMTSLNDHLFWVNQYSKRLYWADKKSTTNYNKKITLDLPEEPEKLHIVSVASRPSATSLCHTNNNNCSHLCLMSHMSVVCACPTGWEMSKDNHTCIKQTHCNSYEYLCLQSNMCILKSLRCDGHKDCIHGEDEDGCVRPNVCPKGLFQCNNGDCIREEFVCDHNYDCRDKSDEQNCNKRNSTSQCLPQQFKCDSGSCISEHLLCDDISDCLDRSDEHNCKTKTCLDYQFRCQSGACIPKTWECDHEFDCTDLSDEHGFCSSVTCPPNLFTCTSGKCIDKKLICDDVDDCGDNSDEHTCYIKTSGNCNLDEIPCSSNESFCIPHSARCNGTSECPQEEDEKDCSNCMEAEFTCKNRKCIPVEWICDKHDDCEDYSDEKAELCANKNDTLRQSVTTSTSCEHGFRCKNGNCIDLNLVCDGKHDCYDGSDEDGLCFKACQGQQNPCSQDCFKTPSGSRCKCKPGYILQGDGHTCLDHNECLDDPPVCSQLCHNEEGGYRCDCFKNFLLRSNKKSCKSEGQPMSLVYTIEGQIRELSQRTNHLSILYSAQMPKITGFDVIAEPKVLYFSTESALSIHRVDLTSQVRHYMENVGQPQKLAVDWSTNNIYYYNADSKEKSISVCNFEQMVCAKLIDIDIHRQVSAITVDPVNKALFVALGSWWVFNSPTYIISKYNLDGSGSQELVKTSAGYITGLTYDYNRKYLYYLDQHSNQISMMNYGGQQMQPLFTNITRSWGLRFFEDHLYYLTSGGYFTKCRLYGSRLCDNVKLHSYSTDFFAVVQESVQPKVENVCLNHTCSYLCVPNEMSYKCICRDGQVIAKNKECVPLQDNPDGHPKLYLVHSVPTSDGFSKKNTGVILTAILIPLILLIAALVAVYIMRRKNSKQVNVSMRFYKSTYKEKVDDEKPILQPGMHEYTNPVHFKRGESEYGVDSVNPDPL